MKKITKYYGIRNHIIILLVFFAGMLLNYFLISPIIDAEETKRIQGDLDRYVSNFINPTVIDSVRSSVEDPYSGHFLICTPEAEIIFDTENHIGENAFSVIENEYGEIASDIFRQEVYNPGYFSRMVYDKALDLSFFASYETDYNLVFFYVADYKVTGSRTILAFRILFGVFLLGGILIMILCFSNIKKLTRNAVNESANEKELENASAIQMSMLPRGSRHLLQLDIDARLLPAKKVGGDLYYYVLKDGILYFCIGDVSGKGIPASLCMARAVSLFRIFALRGMSPSQIAHGINEELCINNEQCLFLTAFIGAMKVVDGKMTFCNAGHEAPLYWNGSQDSAVEFLKSSPNYPLGFDSSSEYSEDELVMDKNGLILLYTDGVNEGRSKDGLYGRERLRILTEKLRSLSASEINTGIVDAVMNFERGEEQSDDITLFTLRNIRLPKKLRIKNDIKELKVLPAYCSRLFEECPFDSKIQMRLRSGLDEALTNCVRYAYPEGGHDIFVQAWVKDGKLYIEIKDSGIPFNPLEYSSDVQDPLKIGGLGIPIIKSSFDDLKYERTEGFNILTLIKNL